MRVRVCACLNFKIRFSVYFKSLILVARRLLSSWPNLSSTYLNRSSTSFLLLPLPLSLPPLLTQQQNDKTAAPGEEITTQLAPQTKARDAQTLAVKKTFVPEICQTGAKYGDLVELKYTSSLADGTFLDATGVSTPGRGGDSTIYFVLGEQVAGTVPKGWDLALVGACVGEKRVIRTPSVLAYGSKGLKRRGIPPDATIIYNVEVIGINGNNLPR